MTTSAPAAGLPVQVAPPGFALSRVGPHAVVGVDVVALPVLTGEGDDVAPDPAQDAAGPGLLLGPGAEELGEELGVDLLAVLEAAGATGRAGEITPFPVPLGSAGNAELRLVLMVGVGRGTPADLRRAGAALARATRDKDAVATSLGAVADDAGLEALVAGLMLGSFLFHWRSGEPPWRPVGRVVLADVDPALQPVLERAIAVGGAGWRARALATVPSNLKSPAWLAAQAEEVAAEAGLTYRVWDEQQLAAGGFGGLLAVGAASATPPRLVRLDYTPRGRGARKAPTVVLVGKGITFDSGGLSIKPGEAMASMKRDMTGAGVVLATMAALAEVGCPVKVVGLLACAENAVSGSAMRPGDVIRHYGGRTTEVTNTDAEGRLVMADALAYAVEQVEPAVLVDVATLTGAVKVALGQRTGGLFATDDALADALLAAGRAAGEPLWRLPLHAGYEEKLASPVADADNAAGGPGSITAALFLQHFTGGLPWAHLDIASVGDAPSDSFEWTAGPTGFGARALLGWLGSADPLAGVGA